jgi:diguanylate cyclase (GGDEF)-like protein
MSIARHALLTITSDKGTVAKMRELLGPAQAVTAAVDVQEGFTEAQTGEPGLILLDSKLAGLDVQAFCQKLKGDTRTSGIPVLLLAPSDRDGIKGLEQGADDYLVSPVQPTVVRTRIRNYMDLGRCIEALRRFSLIDGVTGIANRRRFDEFLTLEWRRNLRNHTPLSIVVMDLDHFMAYSGHYGATAGDECLKRIALAFQDATQRPGDLVASYGKDGFACILPETDTLGAVSVAERMRAELATLAIPHAKSTTASILTMSVGTATRVPTGDVEPEDLIALAERSLGEAKRAGRNRVVFGN